MQESNSIFMKLSLYSGNLLQMYYFGAGQKIMHVSYNQWSLAFGILVKFQTVYQLKIQLNITLYSSIIVKANPFENVEAEEQEELFEPEGKYLIFF